MEALTLAQFASAAADFDAQCLRATELVDAFCASSAWILPATAALMPPREPWLWRGPHGYIAAMRHRAPQRITIEPLEFMWGLASPLVGEPALVDDLLDSLRADRAWHRCYLAGLTEAGPWVQRLSAHLPRTWRLAVGPLTIRHQASLQGGVNGYWARRSANWRRAASKALRAAEQAHIDIAPVQVSVDDAPALYARLQAIEATSWKGAQQTGIAEEPLKSFYADMLPRLAATGRARLMIARHDERDVAFILGAVFGQSYRGLQFSQTAAYAKLGLGNVCQLHQLAALCAEGVARYDLGTEMAYKQRWAEAAVPSATFVILP